MGDVLLWEFNEFALLVFFVVVLATFAETGYRLGRRRDNPEDASALSHIGALQAALLGLLALLLGFTFSMAVSRFDTRKALVLEEANVIGTAQLRSMLLPSPFREDTGAILNQYIEARLAFHDAGNDTTAIARADATANQLQVRLWSAARTLAEQDPRSAPVALFIESLNDVFDAQEKRRTALENHVPVSVIYLLVMVSGIALSFVAYSGAMGTRRRHGSTWLFGLLVALVLTIIIDIDRPRRGLIQIGQEPMLRLKAEPSNPAH